MKNYNQEYTFIYKKPKCCTFTFIFYFVLIIVLLLYFSVTKTYSKLNCKAIVSNNHIIVSSFVENINTIAKSDFMKINDKKYSFKIINYSELYNNGKINLQDIELSSSYKNENNNQIIDVTFYYNEEKIIFKILKGVLQ